MSNAPEMPQPDATTPAPTAAAGKRSWFARHKVLTGIGVGAVVIAGFTGISGGGDSADADAPAASQSVSAAATTGDESATDATATDEAVTEKAAESTATEKKATEKKATEKKATEKKAAAKKATVLEDGDYIVGTDIAAGQYRADVADGFFELCTVSQTAKNGEDVIDVRNATEGSVIFDVANKKGSVVTFSGCENIVSTKDVPGTAPKTLTNGDWLVGNQIKAGRYSATVDTDADLVLGTAVQYDKSDVVSLKNGDNGKVVFTVKDIPGSVVSLSGFDTITKL